MLKSIALALALLCAGAGSAAAGGRPASCPPRRWCGCWLAAHFGLSDRALWRAITWRERGMALLGPAPGAIVVWRHHVGQVLDVAGDRILVLSGNDGRAVRARWRSTAGVIAYRTLPAQP